MIASRAWTSVSGPWRVMPSPSGPRWRSASTIFWGASGGAGPAGSRIAPMPHTGGNGGRQPARSAAGALARRAPQPARSAAGALARRAPQHYLSKCEDDDQDDQGEDDRGASQGRDRRYRAPERRVRPVAAVTALRRLADPILVVIPVGHACNVALLSPFLHTHVW